MVSGSQLQVAKLAQMCPAAPSSAQWRPAVLSGDQRWPVATRVKTQMEHLIAPNVLLKQTRHLFMSV